MEKSSSSNNTLSPNLVDLLFLNVIFDLKHNFSRFFSSSSSQSNAKLQSLASSKATISEQKNNNNNFDEASKKDYSTSSNEESDADDGSLLGRDISIVMKRLGIEHGFEGEEIQKKWGCSELSGLFEEEPTLEEVKEAFDVFDQNTDGFIDAEELQRVICALGLKQGVELQECRRMIRSFDLNNDGKIDFNEFVGFMLNNF